MNRRAVLAAVPLAAVTLLAAGPAAADPSGAGRSFHVVPSVASGVAEGLTCGMHSTADPTRPDVQTGPVWGGPLTADSPGATISMRCTVQVGDANSTHAGADACSISSSPSPQTTAASPTLCSYRADDDDSVHLCTEATINGVTYYWHADLLPRWTTSSTARCAEATKTDLALTTPGFWEIVDSFVCPVFRALYPGLPGAVDITAQGDVYVLGIWVWDCPPYA